MKSSKFPLLFTLFVVLAMLLSACGQAAAPEASEPADTEAEAAPTTEAAAPAEAESSEPAAEAEAVGEGYSIGISMPTKS
ncbi:MAG: hypothetical protein KDJ97_14375, partial [Anaerolineae bacterium]|nr:hypothetical protein [Anaerolineae bacterium]